MSSNDPTVSSDHSAGGATASSTSVGRASGSRWTVQSKKHPERSILGDAPAHLNYTFRRISQPPGHTDLFEVSGHDFTTGVDYCWSGHEEDLRKAAGADATLASVASRANLANNRLATERGQFSMSHHGRDIKVEWCKESVNGDGTDSCITYEVHQDGEVMTHGGWTESALAEQTEVGNQLAGELLARSKGLSSRCSGASGTVHTSERTFEWAHDGAKSTEGPDHEMFFQVTSKAQPGNTDIKPGKRTRSMSLAQLKNETDYSAVAEDIVSVHGGTTSNDQTTMVSTGISSNGTSHA
ncbi:hypothetical protein I317_07077 [Kwoniella heveanensis CBS 569]|nr:hypothetical protein I317_07077 [Kwoniella heveanensis CBS 569]